MLGLSGSGQGADEGSSRVFTQRSRGLCVYLGERLEAVFQRLTPLDSAADSGGAHAAQRWWSCSSRAGPSTGGLVPVGAKSLSWRP